MDTRRSWMTSGSSRDRWARRRSLRNRFTDDRARARAKLDIFVGFMWDSSPGSRRQRQAIDLAEHRADLLGVPLFDVHVAARHQVDLHRLARDLRADVVHP